MFVVGFYIDYFAVAVEGDDFDLILTELGVFVVGEEVRVGINCCHDFEVFEG